MTVGCPISKKDKLIYVLGGLGEYYDNVLSMITEKMLGEKIIMDDGNVVLLSYKSRLKEEELCRYLIFKCHYSYE